MKMFASFENREEKNETIKALRVAIIDSPLNTHIIERALLCVHATPVDDINDPFFFEAVKNP